MIIGINGYIGSGKDTVGSIIQYLHAKNKEEKFIEKAPKKWSVECPKIPSFEDWIKPRIHESGYDIGYHSMYETLDKRWEIKKFAGKLKQIASIMTGIPIEKFEDQEFKKTFLGEQWNYFPKKSEDWASFGKVQMTVRELLQKLGTEAIRDNLHENAWVNALFADYTSTSANFKENSSKIESLNYPNWIITDTRFPNEAKAIKDKKGIVVRVRRDSVVTGSSEIAERIGLLKTYAHPSETSLDTWQFDYVIDNNGTLDELIVKVKNMLTYFELL